MDTKPPDATLVINEINEAIRLRLETQQAPGWTNWAVSAGIGTLFWLLTEVLPQVNFSRQLANLLIAFSVGLDALLALWSTLVFRTVAPSDSSQPNSRRYRSGPAFLSTHRPYMVMYIVRAIAIIVGIVWISGGALNWYTLPIVLVYGVGIAAFSIFFLLSVRGDVRSPSQASRNRYNRYVWMFPIIFTFVMLVGAGQILFDAFVDWRLGAVQQADIRFAGIIVTIIFLLSMIVTSRRDPMIAALHRTRRDLAFGRIDATTAVQRAETALMGAYLSDFLREDIDVFFKKLEHAQSELAQAGTAEASVVTATIDSSDQGNGLVHRRDSPLSRVHEVLLELVAKRDQIGKRRIFRVKPDEEAIAILVRMDCALTELKERYQSTRDSTEAVISSKDRRP